MRTSISPLPVCAVTGPVEVSTYTRPLPLLPVPGRWRVDLELAVAGGHVHLAAVSDTRTSPLPERISTSLLAFSTVTSPLPVVAASQRLRQQDRQARRRRTVVRVPPPRRPLSHAFGRATHRRS